MIEYSVQDNSHTSFMRFLYDLDKLGSVTK